MYYVFVLQPVLIRHVRRLDTWLVWTRSRWADWFRRAVQRLNLVQAEVAKLNPLANLKWILR